MLLLNKHKDNIPRDAVYIGRGSPLGNPYKIGEHGSRTEVIEKYRTWLKEKICNDNRDVIDALHRLNDSSKLSCFCHPLPCHGQVISEIWNEIMECGDFYHGLKLYRDKWNLTREQAYRSWLIAKLVVRDPQVTMDFRELDLTRGVVPEEFRGGNSSQVLIKLHNEVMAQNDYDKAIIELAKKEGFLHMPHLDGITHINVYSKAQTSLGQALSNFAHISFIHPKDGKCESVEGYWYFLKSGREYPYLKELYGINAKNEGKKHPRVEDSDFIEDIKDAITCKIVQNSDLERDFKASTLPFTHYYWYGSLMSPRIMMKETDKWLIDHLESLRTSLLKE